MMFWTIRRFVLDIPYRVRSIRFRLRYGFRMEDTWALDTAMARFLAPRLRHLAEHHAGWPGRLCIEPEYNCDKCAFKSCDELWAGILNKMADGFEIIVQDNTYCLDNYEDYEGYIEECLDLFREFFFDLWN